LSERGQVPDEEIIPVYVSLREVGRFAGTVERVHRDEAARAPWREVYPQLPDSLSIQRLKGSRHAIRAIQEHRRQPLLDEITALRAWLKERREDGSNALFTSPRAGT
jgi:hypothetical protein